MLLPIPGALGNYGSLHYPTPPEQRQPVRVQPFEAGTLDLVTVKGIQLGGQLTTT